MTKTLTPTKPATSLDHTMGDVGNQDLSIYEEAVAQLEAELRDETQFETMIGLANLAMFLRRTEQFLETSDEVPEPEIAISLRRDHLATITDGSFLTTLKAVTGINKRSRRRHIHSLTYGQWTQEQAARTVGEQAYEADRLHRRFISTAVLPCRYCASMAELSADMMPAREVISELAFPLYRMACGHSTFKEHTLVA